MKKEKKREDEILRAGRGEGKKAEKSTLECGFFTFVWHSNATGISSTSRVSVSWTW
jgi:hypothetical protein